MLDQARVMDITHMADGARPAEGDLLELWEDTHLRILDGVDGRGSEEYSVSAQTR